VKHTMSLLQRYCFWFLFVMGVLPPGLMGQAPTVGSWSTATYTMPINPIHVTLLHNGKILVVAGSGNCPPSQSGCPSSSPYGPGNQSGALVLDPSTGNITQFNVSWDMFCNDMVPLPDGRVFINGGTLQYDPFFGLSKSSIFDPVTNTFTDVPKDMAHGRWYPTLTTLGDGRLMTFAGVDENGNTNTTVEIYSVASGWTSPTNSGWTPPFYPRMHLLPNGKVFYSGSTSVSRLFDPAAQTWSNVATTIYGGSRTYGSSVLLPLTPDNAYDPQVLIMGGDRPATATSELIDLGASNPSWTPGPSMSQPRIEMNAVVLPSGQVLALGGSQNDEDTSTLSLNADIYDPATNTFSSAGSNSFGRLYHSVAMLLPDASVWVAGGNPTRGSFEKHVEIYRPAYLYGSDGTLATRPAIASAPNTISYGNPFTVQTPDAPDTTSAVLIRNGSVTHAFGMDQRMVGMSFTVGSGSLTVTAPPNGNIAPPGYYMLFLLNSSGVPSIATSVLLSSSATPAPIVNSVLPTSGTTAGGTSVTISGTGFQSGATVSFGGTLATNVNVVSGTSITAITAAKTAGAVDVIVTNSDTQNGRLSNGFTYTAPGNPKPTVSSISPSSGPASGGTSISITGSGFLTGATVSLGGTAAANVSVLSGALITAKTATHNAGSVDVIVTNSDTQSGTLSAGFSYTAASNPAPTVTTVTPNSGSSAGGTTVTIGGTGFLPGTTVTLGGTAATGVTVVSSTSLLVTTPAHSAGPVNVVVTNGEEQSGALSNGYTYFLTNPAPTVTSITPSAGTSNGGTSINVTGTGFLPGATLTLGGTSATSVTVLGSASMTAVTPAHTAETVNVVITNTDAQNGSLPNGYLYTSGTTGLGLVVPSGDMSSATVLAGQTASYFLSIGGEGMSGTASLTCSGAPKGATCSAPGAQTFNATAPVTFQVKVTTTPRTTSSLGVIGLETGAWMWSFGLLGMLILPGTRGCKSLPKYLLVAPFALLLFFTACGGGGGGTGGGQSTTLNPNGTPAGTYTLNVTASSTGAGPQTTSLTLVVQ